MSSKGGRAGQEAETGGGDAAGEEEKEEGGEDASLAGVGVEDEESEAVSASMSGSFGLRLTQSSRLRSSSATVAQLMRATPSAVLPHRGSLARVVYQDSGEDDGEGDDGRGEGEGEAGGSGEKDSRAGEGG